MKINLGSHNKKIGEDYINVDILPLENVQVVHDLTEFPWPFKSGEVEEIVTQDFLEHIDFKFTVPVLKECRRILKEGGELNIQVPNIGKMCEYYVNKQICSCCPHKSVNWEFKANPDCPNCKGEAKINPTRWLYAFIGAQKHDYDYHHNIFTKELLTKYLLEAGFEYDKIIFREDIYKLKCKIKK